MLNGTAKCNRLIGDHPALYRHRSYRHFFTSEREAQKLADAICADLALKPWRVYFTKKLTRRNHGKANPTTRNIRLQLIGETVGVLLHEMSHDDLSWQSHGRHFKNRQLVLAQWYDANYPNDPPPAPATSAEAAAPTTPDLSNDPDLVEIFRDVSAKLLESHDAVLILEPEGVVRCPNSYPVLRRIEVLGAAIALFTDWGATVTAAAGRLTVEL